MTINNNINGGHKEQSHGISRDLFQREGLFWVNIGKGVGSLALQEGGEGGCLGKMTEKGRFYFSSKGHALFKNRGDEHKYGYIGKTMMIHFLIKHI